MADTIRSTEITAARRNQRLKVVPNPTTADADDNYTYTVTRYFFQDGKKYNVTTGADV